MDIKSFDEYFKGYTNYDNGGKLDQISIADAKKVFEKLKTPEAIDQFHKADYKTQQKMVAGLDDGHSGSSFFSVYHNAYRYAIYAQKYVKEDTQSQINEEAINRVRSKLPQEQGQTKTQQQEKQEKINAEFSQWLKDNTTKPTRE